MSASYHSRHSPGSAVLGLTPLGVPEVVVFGMSGVAPLTVAAGVVPTAYATTGLRGIPAAFMVVAVILGLFSVGYVAMARHITNAGAFYAFVSRGLGRVFGVGAALVAVVAYHLLQIGLVRHEALCVSGWDERAHRWTVAAVR